MNNNEDFIYNVNNLQIENLAPYRPTMGNDTAVLLWRLVRIVGFHKILEAETPAVLYFTGKHIGKMLKAKNFEDIKKMLTDLKIGKLDFPVVSEKAVHMAISECVTCSGITPPLGKPICQLEAGILIGALQSIYPDLKVTGEETKCMGGLGDSVCLVECRLI